MVGLSILTALIFLTMLVRFMLLQYSQIATLCSYVIPCIMLYSRFPGYEYQIYYVLTLIAFLIIMFISIMGKWMNFDKLMKIDELKNTRKNNVAQMYFNLWDWSINNSHEAFEMRSIYQRELKLQIDEEKIRSIIRNRTQSDKVKLIFRRVITVSISIVILVCGWGGIVMVNYYEKDIANYFK